MVDLSKEQAERSIVLLQAHQPVHIIPDYSGAGTLPDAPSSSYSQVDEAGGIVTSCSSAAPSASNEHDLTRDGHPSVGASDIPKSHSSSSVAMNDLAVGTVFMTPGSRFVSCFDLVPSTASSWNSFTLLSKAHQALYATSLRQQ